MDSKATQIVNKKIWDQLQNKKYYINFQLNKDLKSHCTRLVDWTEIAIKRRLEYMPFLRNSSFCQQSLATFALFLFTAFIISLGKFCIRVPSYF